MGDALEVDICVVGAGSGGLLVAAAAALLGRRVALVERGRMGGDCLNYGCVPSKSLIAAAKRAALARTGGDFGIDLGKPTIDFARVHAHVERVIAAIAPHDSQERFEGLGCKVIRAEGRFVGPDVLAAGGARIRARRFVIATGSSPAIPPLEGLAQVPYLTNETVFELKARPEHLIVIGGGPIGVELAQAFARLGAKVSVVELLAILGNDDAEAAEVVRQALRRDGVALYEGTRIRSLARAGDGIAATIERDGESETLLGSHLLVAAGRSANVAGLGLEAAGVAFTARGITVDRRLRTTNRRIYALGDVAGRYQFTHMAGHHAGVVVRNALFRLPAKVEERAIPWVTFTDPELAHVGLKEDGARAAHGAIRILRWAFAENDRAQTEREIDGFAKVITTRRGRVVGATIVGAHAGELILPWGLAIARCLRVSALAGLIAPYPTLSEISKSVAGSFFTPTLFGERTKRLVRFLARFG
ncbi:MAG TPA: FAD-dependent oxidoreductase [Alphaproteobacteria bacterium]|nr:FAD-dependent oxidoreductase [Alphaproteobacteria bacterium]